MSEHRLADLMGDLKQLDYKISNAKSLCYHSKTFNDDCPGLNEKANEILKKLEDGRRDKRNEINSCKLEIKLDKDKKIATERLKKDTKEIKKKIKEMNIGM